MASSGIETIRCYDPIPLPQAVARHLLSIADQAWDHLLVILPTLETGRRVVDALLQRTKEKLIFPPRFATPLTWLPFGEGEGVATSLQAELAWRKTLLNAGRCSLTFGEHSSTIARESLANAFVILMRDLAAANLNIPAASKILGERDPRWTEWGKLWKDYIHLLAGSHLQCPAEVQLTTARDFHLPPGISRLIVAGVYDLPPLTWEALRHCEAQLFLYAPGLTASDAAFDERGRAQAKFWAKRLIPQSPENIRVVADFDELARETALSAKRLEGQVAFISGDTSLSLEISTALTSEGMEGFLPEGTPLTRHPIVRLAILLLRLRKDATWKNLDELLRHPDFLENLEREKIWYRRELGQWNRLGQLAFEPPLKKFDEHLEQACMELREDQKKQFIRSFLPLIKKMQHIAERLSVINAAPALREILSEIYGPRNMAKRSGDKDALKAIIRVLDEIAASPALSDVNTTTLETILESLPGSWTAERNPTAIEIEGWLELLGEDSPAITIAGLNEGLLPSRRRADPLLPDTARKLLGLDDAASRHARDAAILHAAIVTRKPGALQIFSVLRATDGSPLKPSRLLLRTPENDLPARILELCPESINAAHISASDRFPKAPLRIPRVLEPLRFMRVTDFAAYLNCPLRFYLSRRLGMKTPESVEPILQSVRFGTWIHEILRQFGQDAVLRESQDAEEIRSFLLSRWDSLFKGFEENLDLMLQREAGRMRLEQFSTKQAEVRAEGWRIQSVECPFTDCGSEEIRLPGWLLPLRGRIDRVDVREDSVRLIDYKTGSYSTAKLQRLPRSSHLTKTRPATRFGTKPEFAAFHEEIWCDLQLPLYAIVFRRMHALEAPADIRLAYFLLPDDIRQTGIYEWRASSEEIQSAADCARAIMDETASDVVLNQIAARDFRRFAVELPRDDFASLSLSRFIESGALEVAS